MSLDLATVVAATDFSDEGGKAVGRAAMLAQRHGAELQLLHVVNRASLDAVREWVREPADCADRLVRDTRQLLEESAASTGMRTSARLVVGEVVEEILSSCARGRILVVGAHGLNPLRDAILGTTAERLVGRCECPILIVREQPQKAYARVLAAVDLRPGSEDALAAAVRIAPGAKMAAVHAYDVPFEGALQRAGVAAHEIDKHRAAAFHHAMGAIGTLSSTVSGDPGLFLPVVERTHAARLILQHQQILAADLIVIGKRRRPVVESLLLGSTTRHVLADASCDVLVVPLER